MRRLMRVRFFSFQEDPLPSPRYALLMCANTFTNVSCYHLREFNSLIMRIQFKQRIQTIKCNFLFLLSKINHHICNSFQKSHDTKCTAARKSELKWTRGLTDGVDKIQEVCIILQYALIFPSIQSQYCHNCSPAQNFKLVNLTSSGLLDIPQKGQVKGREGSVLAKVQDVYVNDKVCTRVILWHLGNRDEPKIQLVLS